MNFRVHDSAAERDRLASLLERGMTEQQIADKMKWPLDLTKQRLRVHGLVNGFAEPKYCPKCKQIDRKVEFSGSTKSSVRRCKRCGQALHSKYFNSFTNQEERPEWDNRHRGEYEYDADVFADNQKTERTR